MLIPLVNRLCCRRAAGLDVITASMISPPHRPWMMRASCAPTPASAVLFDSLLKRWLISLDFSILYTHVLIFGTHVGRRWFGSPSNLVFFFWKTMWPWDFFFKNSSQRWAQLGQKLLRRSSSSNNRGYQRSRGCHKSFHRQKWILAPRYSCRVTTIASFPQDHSVQSCTSRRDSLYFIPNGEMPSLANVTHPRTPNLYLDFHSKKTLSRSGVMNVVLK